MSRYKPWGSSIRRGLLFQLVCHFHRYWAYSSKSTVCSRMESCFQEPVLSVSSFRRTDAETEAPIVWPPDAKSRVIGKDPDAGKDWGQEYKRVTEGEMVGWHQRLNGCEFEQTPGDSGGQKSLECCSLWSHQGIPSVSWRLLTFVSIELVMLSNPLPLSSLFAFSLSQHQGVSH